MLQAFVAVIVGKQCALLRLCLCACLQRAERCSCSASAAGDAADGGCGGGRLGSQTRTQPSACGTGTYPPVHEGKGSGERVTIGVGGRQEAREEESIHAGVQDDSQEEHTQPRSFLTLCAPPRLVFPLGRLAQVVR
eukprot:778239-Rhodomonas_salina.2